jgi:hypothetical protein
MSLLEKSALVTAASLEETCCFLQLIFTLLTIRINSTMDSMGSKKRIIQDMSSNVFPEITFRDGMWFLRYWCNGEIVREIDLPNNPMMNRIWEASSNLLNVYIDDCGANLDRCVEVLREASKNFAGISELLADEAKKTQDDIEYEELYRPDDNEPWYNR